ncbi:MAG: hypothetical protein JJU13_11010 [Balneolaceae bacterium]|nr:hypothetical protein [Balneolaceae bacterium]
MAFSLKRIDKLSGKKATVYSVQLNDGTDLFNQFLNENSAEYEDDVKNILQRIRSISRKTGAQEHFFKTKEGNPGDGVCALYDTPGKHLRLYCIRMGNTVIILGGGGPKPEGIRALQEDPKLKHENYLLRDISKEITDKMTNGKIRFSDDELELLGDIITYE